MNGVRSLVVLGCFIFGSTTLLGQVVPEGGVFKVHTFFQDAVVADASNPSGLAAFDPYEIEFFISGSVLGTQPYDGAVVSWSGAASPQNLMYNSGYMDYSIDFSSNTPISLADYPDGAYTFQLTNGGTPISSDPQDEVTLTLDQSATTPVGTDGTFPELLGANNVPRLKLLNGSSPIFNSGGLGSNYILIDPSLDNTFTWNAPIFSDADNAVVFFIDDTDAMMNGALFDTALLQTSDSLTIPSSMGIFNPGDFLEIGIGFVNVVDQGMLGVSPNEISLASGFITETIFYAQVIPEPSTYALMLVGGVVLFWFFRRKV